MVYVTDAAIRQLFSSLQSMLRGQPSGRFMVLDTRDVPTLLLVFRASRSLVMGVGITAILQIPVPYYSGSCFG